MNMTEDRSDELSKKMMEATRQGCWLMFKTLWVIWVVWAVAVVLGGLK